MISVVILGLVCIALIAALVYRERAHDTERKGLLDRIEAPAASQAAAVSRVLPAPEPAKEPDPVYVRPTDSDLTVEQLLEAI